MLEVNAEPELTPREVRCAQRVLIDGRLVSPFGTHGKRYNYVDNGCECDPCREANRIGTKEAKARRFKRTADNGGIAPTATHNAGTYTNWNCRCVPCKVAWAADCRDRKAKAREARRGTAPTRRKHHATSKEPDPTPTQLQKSSA